MIICQNYTSLKKETDINMTLFLLLAVLFAFAQALVVHFDRRRLEHITKPAVMLFLLAYLFSENNGRTPLLWFSLGIFFSLAGDIFLIAPDRFLPGLVAFLLAHVCYIIGLNLPPAPLSALTLGLAIFIALTVFPVIRRILLAMRHSGQDALVAPVQIYATVITLMLLSALLTIFRTDWTISAAMLVGLGAFFFIASDVVLAWNKFVAPLTHGRLVNIVLYQLGQILLVIGAAMQFSG